MWIDIRLPIGMLFSTFGIILSAFGLFGGGARYEKSLGVNVNLIWGLMMLVFGIFMFVLGKTAKKTRATSVEAVSAPIDPHAHH
jgi:hypothetical protein